MKDDVEDVKKVIDFIAKQWRESLKQCIKEISEKERFENIIKNMEAAKSAGYIEDYSFDGKNVWFTPKLPPNFIKIKILND